MIGLTSLHQRYQFLLGITESTTAKDLLPEGSKLRNIWSRLNTTPPRESLDKSIVDICCFLDEDLETAENDKLFKEKLYAVTHTIFSEMKITTLSKILSEEVLMTPHLQDRINWLQRKIFLAQEKLNPAKLILNGLIVTPHAPENNTVEKRLATALKKASIQLLISKEEAEAASKIFDIIHKSDNYEQIQLLRILPYPLLIVILNHMSESFTLERFIEIIFKLNSQQFRDIIISFDNHEIPRLETLFKNASSDEKNLISLHFSQRLMLEQDYTNKVIRERMEKLIEKFHYSHLHPSDFDELLTLKNLVEIYQIFLDKLEELMSHFIQDREKEILSSLQGRYERFNLRLTKGDAAEKVDNNLYTILAIHAFNPPDEEFDSVQSTPSDDGSLSDSHLMLHSPDFKKREKQKTHYSLKDSAAELIMERWNIGDRNDYVALGLLDSVTQVIHEDFNRIKANIQGLGFLTIQDLKDRDIYSKAYLKRYIFNLKKQTQRPSAAAAAAGTPN